MKKEITITAEPRQSRGKNEARRLRARDLAPAVLYGAKRDAVPLTLSPKEIRKILNSSTGHNTIFNVAVNGGETSPVMIVDWQSDPVRETLLHVDLKRIDLTQRIAVKVPVHTTGEPKGVKIQGGLYEIVTREIEIECLPNEIPDGFTVDVSELMIGQNLRASDIPVEGSMKLLSPADQVIAHVVTMRAEEVVAATPEAGAAPVVAEPEVIKKGKKEEEAIPPAAEEKGKKKQ